MNIQKNLKSVLNMTIGLALLAVSANAAEDPCHADSLNWDHPERIEITLTSFKFTPKDLVLKVCMPYELVFVNKSGGAHNFDAPEFLASALVKETATTPAQKPKFTTIELKANQSVKHLIIATSAARFPLVCSHPFHKNFGMKGTILVKP